MRIVLVALFALQIWATVLFVQNGWKAIADPYQLDYGEGAVLDQAVRLAEGQPIYRTDLSTPPYVINVYPPLYLAAQVPFLKWWGPAFWYGRAMSVLSACLAALLIVLTLRHITKTWIESILGGLMCLAIPYITYWATLFRIDTLGLFLSWGALFTIVRWPKARWSFLIGAFLFVAAIYTRQSYLLAAPLTAACWLWAQSGWRRALAFLMLLGGLSLGIFLALDLATGGGFYFNTITILKKQVLSQDILRYYVEEISTRLPLLLIAAGALGVAALKTRENSLRAFALPYLIGSFASAATIGKPGSNVNYLIEFAAALSISAALLILWLKRWPWLRNLALVLFALQTYLLIQWSQGDYPLAHYATPHIESPQIAQLIHLAKGPVLTDEYIGLLLFDHRPVYIQPFDFATLSKNGSWDQQPFLDMLDRREFALVILYNPSDSLLRQRWTKEMLQHIRQNYPQVEHLRDNEIYTRSP